MPAFGKKPMLAHAIWFRTFGFRAAHTSPDQGEESPCRH